MAAKAIQMERLKQILWLKQNKFSVIVIARNLGFSRATLIKYLGRLGAADPAPVSDEQLSAASFNHDTYPHKWKRQQRLFEHLVTPEKELRRTGVTRQLLWIKYTEQQIDGHNRS